MKLKPLATWDLQRGYTIILTVGLLGHLFQATRPLMLALTPLFLLFSAALFVYNLARSGNRAAWTWFIFVALGGFAVEVLGVNSGRVFGPYRYGTTLGYQLWGVPLLIGLNWAMVVYGSVALAQRISPRLWLQLPLAALGPTLLDWFMEPVAIRLDYWQWLSGDIPIQNFLAWFILSFLFALQYKLWFAHSRTDLPAALFVRLLGYFALLYLFVHLDLLV
jgi:putative membrane protein